MTTELHYPSEVNKGRAKLIALLETELPRESHDHIAAVVDGMIDREWIAARFFREARTYIRLASLSYDDDTGERDSDPDVHNAKIGALS